MPRQNRAAAPDFLSTVQDEPVKAFQGEKATQELLGARVREQAPRDDEKLQLLLNPPQGADAPLLHHLRQSHLHGVHRRPQRSRVRPQRRVK